jgi:hypothetical protein
MVGLSEGEKHFIRGGIAQDIRTDGRRRLQFRALSVETGVIPQVLSCSLAFFSFPFWNDLCVHCISGLGAVAGEWFSSC